MTVRERRLDIFESRYQLVGQYGTSDEGSNGYLFIYLSVGRTSIGTRVDVEVLVSVCLLASLITCELASVCMYCM